MCLASHGTHQSTLLVTGPQKPAALCRRYNSGDSKVMSAGAMPCGGGQRAERLRSQDRAGFLDATANESFRKAAHRGAMAGAASRQSARQPPAVSVTVDDTRLRVIALDLEEI